MIPIRFFKICIKELVTTQEQNLIPFDFYFVHTMMMPIPKSFRKLFLELFVTFFVITYASKGHDGFEKYCGSEE